MTVGSTAVYGSLAAFVVVAVTTTYYHIRDDLLHPVVLANVLFTFFSFLPAAYIYSDPHRTIMYDNPLAAVARALPLMLGAYLLVLVGYYATGWVSSHSWWRDRQVGVFAGGEWGPIDLRVVALLGYLGFAVGVLAYLYYVLINGGFNRLFTVVPRTAFQQIPNTGRYKWLGLTGIFGGVVTIFAGFRDRFTDETDSRRLLVALALVGLPLLVALVASVTFRARQPILALGLFTIVYIYTTGRFSDRSIVGMAIFLVLAGVSFTFVETLLLGSGGVHALLFGIVQRARFGAFAGIVQEVPANYPYQYGSTVVGALPFEWPGLPLPYGQQLSRLFGVQRAAVTLSGMLPGELYLNFGAVGLFVGGVVYGVLLRFVCGFRRRFDGVLAGGVYPVLVVVVVMLWETNVLWATKALIFRLGVPLLAALAVVASIQTVRRRLTKTD